MWWQCRTCSILSHVVSLLLVLSAVTVNSCCVVYEVSSSHCKQTKYNKKYLCRLSWHDTHPLAQANYVSSQIHSTMGTRDTAECYNLWAQIPFVLLDLNPVCGEPKEWCLHLVNGPEIHRCSDTTSSYGLDFIRKCIHMYEKKNLPVYQPWYFQWAWWTHCEYRL